MKTRPKHLEHDICDFMQSMSPIKVELPQKRKEIDQGISSAIIDLLSEIGSREERVDKKIDIYNSIIKFTATIKKRSERGV